MIASAELLKSCFELFYGAFIVIYSYAHPWLQAAALLYWTQYTRRTNDTVLALVWFASVFTFPNYCLFVWHELFVWCRSFVCVGQIGHCDSGQCKLDFILNNQVLKQTKNLVICKNCQCSVAIALSSIVNVQNWCGISDSLFWLPVILEQSSMK